MKIIVILLSSMGLVLTILPSLFLLNGVIENEFMLSLMFVGMLAWAVGRLLPHKTRSTIDHEGVI